MAWKILSKAILDYQAVNILWRAATLADYANNINILYFQVILLQEQISITRLQNVLRADCVCRGASSLFCEIKSDVSIIGRIQYNDPVLILSPVATIGRYIDGFHG